MNETAKYQITGRRVVATVVASAAAVVVWVVADPLAGATLTIGSDADVRDVGPGSIIFVTVLMGLAASGLAAVLSRTVPRPQLVWVGCALVILLVSFGGPLGAQGWGTKLTLLLMHLLVGGILIAGIGPTVKDKTAV